MENQNTIRELFDRYLEDKCSREEITLLLAHFNRPNQEGRLRELIEQEIQSVPVSDEESLEALRDVYSSVIKQIHLAGIPRKKLGEMWFGTIPRMAAVWILLLMSAGGALYYFSKYSKTDHILTIVTVSAKKGEQKKVLLNDGSLVWLNSEAFIEYPETFSSGARDITLRGEAYFQVKKDLQRPFTVHAGNVSTRVLGTSFNIRAYPNDSVIAVSVLTGKVQVSAEGLTEPVDLLPDQQAVYKAATQQLSINNDINTTSLISWKEGNMHFRNQTFGEVIDYLSRRYNVEITCDPRIRNCPVLADFDQNDSLELVLKMLVVYFDGKVIHKIDTRQYYLQGEGCS